MSTLLIIVSILLLIWHFFFRKCHPVDELSGPNTVPFFGNTLAFRHGREVGFKHFVAWSRIYFPIFRTWQGSIPVIHPLHPEDIEVILSSSQHITKSHDYDFIRRWLGTGLLISRGSKWHSRRKLLTPAFHFKILEDFLPIFSDNTQVLVSKLRSHVADSSEVNIVPLVTHCALDIICETAMGTKINAQDETNTSPYVSSIYQINDLVIYRMVRPWLYPDWTFRRTMQGEKHDKCLKILHSFTKNVISERKEERKNISKEEKNKLTTEDDGTRKKTALLDLLLQISEEEGGLTDEDIREEVDTFMFEGHDTTAMAMSWGLFFLGAFPDIQEKCVEELKNIFEDSDRSPTMTDLNNMAYLERVIKETLRLRPSVPFIGRQLLHPLKLKGRREFPPGTKINIHIYDVHRNSYIFLQPEEFDPDRFLPENCVDRHPYAYIPFSAGPRNCIGQKFAMLEMKSLLSTVLRNFRLESCNPKRDYEAVPDLILRPKYGIKMRIFEREQK